MPDAEASFDVPAHIVTALSGVLPLAPGRQTSDADSVTSVPHHSHSWRRVRRWPRFRWTLEHAKRRMECVTVVLGVCGFTRACFAIRSDAECSVAAVSQDATAFEMRIAVSHWDIRGDIYRPDADRSGGRGFAGRYCGWNEGRSTVAWLLTPDSVPQTEGITYTACYFRSSKYTHSLRGLASSQQHASTPFLARMKGWLLTLDSVPQTERLPYTACNFRSSKYALPRPDWIFAKCLCSSTIKEASSGLVLPR